MQKGTNRDSSWALGRRSGWLAALALAALMLSGVAAASASAAKAKKTVWLCKPGLANNPCKENRSATVVTYPGGTRQETLEKQKGGKTPVDCFYVYPTVSEQEGPNANEEIEPEETQIAVDQASRFSSVCKVYAPIYPQLTLKAINTPGEVTPEDSAKAYIGVLTAWSEYLKKFNKGRGVVLIGHSQGSLMLIQLIKEQIDPNPALRKQLVSAMLMGGNVLVPEGQLEGGSFQNVPACQAAVQTGCVLAYSSFEKEPPEGAFFGRPNSPLLGGTPPPGQQVLCVNPTLLNQDGSVGPLQPYASTTPFPGELGLFTPAPSAPTPWVSTPGLYTAQCKHENGASWLQVSPATAEPTAQHEERDADHEIAHESLGPDWGLHLYDVNIAVGNLVKTVAIQSQAFAFNG
jgi:Protein of unknown function (DUF3089)